MENSRSTTKNCAATIGAQQTHTHAESTHLGGQLDLELSCEELALKLGVLAHVRGHHTLDLAGLEQDAQPEVIDTVWGVWCARRMDGNP